MSYDLIVIGGGAAGMFAAVTAAQDGGKVLLLERNQQLGKKLRITGKGRCNVTNNCALDEVLQNVPRNGRFLYSAVSAFPPERMMAFLERQGCPLKTERGNRVFPESDCSQSVLQALERALEQAGVLVECGVRVRRILRREGAVCGVETQTGQVAGCAVLLATGGCSYPATGSTGDGYGMAKALGHTIIAPVGSLVPLEAAGDDCQALQGLSLRNVGVKLLEEGKCIYRDFGELLFTHFGVSGPTVLSASSHMRAARSYTLILDLKPALEPDKLEARLLRDLEQYRNRSMEHALADLLPRSLIPVLLRRAEIPLSLQANALTRQSRRALLEALKAFCIPILGKRPVAEAIVTSGGVKTSEVNPRTMESKLVPGLYFAGEILDCDAYTGGFNLQIAWSTAYAAGKAVIQKIDK